VCIYEREREKERERERESKMKEMETDRNTKSSEGKVCLDHYYIQSCHGLSEM
jgi:hypothetical protein